MSRRFATRAVHAGLEPDPGFGDVVPAIHQASTSSSRPRGSPSATRLLAQRQPDPQRARTGARAIEGGKEVCLPQRMAAEHALITAVCKAGDHVVLPDDLYGGTYRLVDKLLNRWGLSYTMVNETDLEAVESAVTDATKLVWVETPTNPTLNVVDIEAIIARKRQRARGGRQHVRHARLPAPLELGADAWSTRPPSTSAATATPSAARRSSRSRRCTTR